MMKKYADVEDFSVVSSDEIARVEAAYKARQATKALRKAETPMRAAFKGITSRPAAKRLTDSH